MTSPLAQLGTTKLWMTQAERDVIASGAELTMLDVAGPGCVKSLWMAISGGNNPTLDARIRVYYDGAATPAIDIDLGTLLASHWGASGLITVDHMHSEPHPSTGDTAFLINFPMPFGQHIRISYYFPPGSTQTAYVYYMATYELTATDLAAGQRLRCSGARYADQSVTRAAGDANTILNTSGGPGSIVYIAYIGGVNAGNLTWMERDFAFTIDGENTPSVRTTGTEDTFDSGWYFQGYSDTRLGRHSAIGANQPSAQTHAVGMVTDLWGKWGGVPYQSSARLDILSEAAVTTGDTFCYCVLYYQ